MLRFALSGVLIVGMFVLLLVSTDAGWPWPTERPAPVASVPAEVQPPRHSTPIIMAIETPVQKLPAPTFDSKPPIIDKPPSSDRRPMAHPTQPVHPSTPVPSEPAPSVLGDLITARELLTGGQIVAAQSLLIKVQTRMVFRPVTPNQPNRDDSNIAATQIGTAIRALSAGNAVGAIQSINLVIASGQAF